MSDDGFGPVDRDAIALHLAYLVGLNRRPQAREQRRYLLRRLSRFVAEFEVGLLDATREAIEAFIARPGRAAQARATEISHVRGFYEWAEYHEYLKVPNPCVRLKRPKLPRRLPRPMPTGDFELAVAQAPERIAPWLWIAGYAGLRACEIAPLRGEDLDFSNRLIMIREQKGGDESSVPMATQLVLVLRSLKPRGWLFPRWDGRGGPISAGQLSAHANRYLHDLGIRHTLHTLRHWYGTEVYESSGGNLRKAQELLRHKTPVSTALYTFINRSELGAIVDRLPAIG